MRAALAVLEKVERLGVQKIIWDRGERLQQSLRALVRQIHGHQCQIKPLGVQLQERIRHATVEEVRRARRATMVQSTPPNQLIG